jgi:serine/threonine-protein kinase RsbW
MAVRYQITRSAELQSLAGFRALIDQACDQDPAFDDQTRYDLKLAVDEACSNIILHGYAGMDPGSIIVSIEIGRDAARVTITDFGQPFEPVELEPPDRETSPEGILDDLGLFFIHESADFIEYESSPAGNLLHLVKYLPKKDQVTPFQ